VKVVHLSYLIEALEEKLTEKENEKKRILEEKENEKKLLINFMRLKNIPEKEIEDFLKTIENKP